MIDALVERIDRVTRGLLMAYFPELFVLGMFFFAVIFAACVGGNQ